MDNSILASLALRLSKGSGSKATCPRENVDFLETKILGVFGHQNIATYHVWLSNSSLQKMRENVDQRKSDNKWKFLQKFPNRKLWATALLKL